MGSQSFCLQVSIEQCLPKCWSNIEKQKCKICLNFNDKVMSSRWFRHELPYKIGSGKITSLSNVKKLNLWLTFGKLHLIKSKSVRFYYFLIERNKIKLWDFPAVSYLIFTLKTNLSIKDFLYSILMKNITPQSVFFQLASLDHLATQHVSSIKSLSKSNTPNP